MKVLCKDQHKHNYDNDRKNNHCVKNIENVSYSKLNVSCYNSVFREGNNLDANAKDGCYDLKQRTYEEGIIILDTTAVDC